MAVAVGVGVLVEVMVAISVGRLMSGRVGIGDGALQAELESRVTIIKHNPSDQAEDAVSRVIGEDKKVNLRN